MSYISAYLETLHNELPNFDDDIDNSYDDEIMTYPLFLEVAKKESDLKDEKADKFYNKYSYRKKESNFPMFTLDRDKILKSRASLMQNFTQSFSKIMIDQNRIMLFTTATMKPEYRLQNSDDTYRNTIKKQHNQFTKYYNHIRYDRFNRDLKYFRAFELHKKGDLHSHSMDFLPDNLDNIYTHINVIKRAKKSKDIGRIEIRLPHKYKNDVIKHYSLKKHQDRYYENLKDYKKGSSLIFTFFQPNKDSYKDISAYILKYTQKNVAYTSKKSNEYYIFRELGIRSFTYSLGILPPLVAYQKVRSQLIQKDERYKDLYELQKDIDKGLVIFNSTYEIKKPEYETRTIEKISKIDKSKDYPIIYTFQSTNDICVFKGSCQLIAVSVIFSDGSSSINWIAGQYERKIANASFYGYIDKNNEYIRVNKDDNGFFYVGNNKFTLYRSLEEIEKIYPPAPIEVKV